MFVFKNKDKSGRKDRRPSDNAVAKRLCRVCNLESLYCRSLYMPYKISGEVTTLATVLSFCANIEVLEEDHFLPSYICSKCIEGLIQVYEYKRTALHTDHILRKRYTELREQRTTALEALSVVAANATRSSSPIASPPDDERHSRQSDNGGVAHANCEYFYVVDDTFEAAESVVDVVETSEHVIEESPEDDLHIESDDQDQKMFTVVDDQDEFDYAIEKENAEDDEVEQEDALPDTTTSMPPKQRTPRRRKSMNPALQCQICGKQLSTTNSFKYHMQLHGDASPFVCTVCGESFKTRNAYYGHITVHDPNNPNKCDVCGKTYRQLWSLRSHMLTHTGVKPFQCDICGKGLTQKSGYKKHLLTHTGEKPHSCEICGRTFRFSSNLIAHKRCHSQEKPYQCDICHKKAFGSSSELNRHKLVHSSDKPFLCTECGKTFKRHVSLVMHQQTHAPSKGSKLKRLKASRAMIIPKAEAEEQQH